MVLPHDRSGLLIEGGLPTKIFSGSIDRWIETMLADDVSEDNSRDSVVKAKVMAKESGIICGKIVINRLFEKYAPQCSYHWNIDEGDLIVINEAVLEINGSSSEILKLERVMLNLLGRLSGISTTTSQWVSQTNNIKIACTRKTEWGILDKWAVHVGGGLTHRLYRSDALMLKENDFASMRKIGDNHDTAIEELILNIDLNDNSEFTVVEVTNLDEALLAAKTWSKIQKKNFTTDSVVLLLDNMGPSNAKIVAEELKKQDLRKWCILEGSGGIKLDNVSEWSTSSVDLISTSSVNRGVKSLDFSLIIEGVV